MSQCLRIISLFFTLFFSMLFTTSSYASFFNQAKTSFLKADQAFVFSFSAQEEQLQLQWQIADGYYLYRKELQIQGYDDKTGTWQNVVLNLPAGEKHQDEFFGEVEIYRHKLFIEIPKNQLIGHKLAVNYQGCTTGLCYPPESKIIELVLSDEVSNTTNNETESLQSIISEQDQLSSQLTHNKYTIFAFFLLGIGLAFTPCVLPMLPLLSAIVIGANQRPTTLRALALSLIYIQGMALTYTLLGLLVASIGLPFQIALQSPYVLIGLSVLFVVLSLSMFGLFEIRLPNTLQNKLSQYSQQQKSGSFSGVFIMGMIAGLVASPCTTAPLSAALLYVAQSGDLLIGGLSLYLLALGMGIPLVLVTVFGNKILPKSGNWLLRVKELFGFVMLLLPTLLLARIFPGYEFLLMRIWIAVMFLWLCYHLGKSWLGWLILIVGIIIGFIYHQPVQQWVSKQFTHQESASVVFQKIHNYEELTQALAQNSQNIAMLDLYADWCVACKEFEKYTFSDSKVQQHFEKVLLLQVDMTKNSPENRELMEKLQVLGLPTIIFFNAQGEEIVGSRVTGFMNGEKFASWLNQLLSK